jgi:hypothetical protein
MVVAQRLSDGSGSGSTAALVLLVAAAQSWRSSAAALR